jgi:MoaA/NifB/PqqE/SkfB family radical SAM enzyme
MQAKAAGAITLLRTTGTWPIDIKRVQQAFDWVDMSVDAVDEAMYTRMRGRPGLTVLLRQTEALLAAGIRVRFNCLLSSVNQSHLLPVMDLAKGVGVRYVRYSPFIARGKAASSGIRQKHGLAAGELDNVYALIRSYAAAVGIAVSVVTTVKNRAIFIVKPNGDVFFPLDAGLMTLGNVVGRDLVSMFPVELLRRHCGAYWAHNCSTSP